MCFWSTHIPLSWDRCAWGARHTAASPSKVLLPEGATPTGDTEHSTAGVHSPVWSCAASGEARSFHTTHPPPGLCGIQARATHRHMHAHVDAHTGMRTHIPVPWTGRKELLQYCACFKPMLWAMFRQDMPYPERLAVRIFLSQKLRRIHIQTMTNTSFKETATRGTGEEGQPEQWEWLHAASPSAARPQELFITETLPG